MSAHEKEIAQAMYELKVYREALRVITGSDANHIIRKLQGERAGKRATSLKNLAVNVANNFPTSSDFQKAIAKAGKK